MNRQGRPTAPIEAVSTTPRTFTGNRALRIEEALLFEIGRPEVTGVDLDEPAAFTPRLGNLERKAPIGLPGLSEPETLRHYVRLSRMNYGIDTGMFPLGSCTMKHNPRLNEKMPRLPGFGDSATAGMPVNSHSQFESRWISSTAPSVVFPGCSGWMSAKPAKRAIFSFRRGLCFMVHEPSGNIPESML